MTILVTAASEHGATAEIAARIGAGLAERGFAVDVKRPDEAHDLTHYDAFVVGSAVYMGHWLKAAKTFVDAHADELSERPTWLFSSGPIVGDPPTPVPEDARAGDALAEAVHARGHAVFAGKLDKGELNWCEKLAVRAAHAGEGDFRDWDAIDEWTAGIARELRESNRLTAA